MMDKQLNNSIEHESFLHKESKKEKVKATFSLLDHFVKVYNSGESYVKRGITLFGLGTIFAGVAFGTGQQLPSSEVKTSNKTASTAPTTQPTVIYVPMPTVGQATTPSQPSAKTTSPTNSVTKTQQKVTAQPVAAPIQPKPTVNPAPASPTTSQPSVAPKPSVNSVPSNSPKQVQETIAQVRQTVEPVKEIGGAIAEVKQAVPIFKEIVAPPSTTQTPDEQND
jgi:hypothetical protein